MMRLIWKKRTGVWQKKEKEEKGKINDLSRLIGIFIFG